MATIRGRKKGGSMPVIFVTAFVLFGTWLAFTRPVPERVYSASSDGHVVLEGRGPKEAEAFVRLRAEKGRPYPPLRSSVYELALPVSGSFTSTFHFVPEQGEAPGIYTLYTSPDGEQGWVSVPAVLDPFSLTLTRAMTFADQGFWAVGIRIAGE